jgi:hypothetical protein
MQRAGMQEKRGQKGKPSLKEVLRILFNNPKTNYA